MTECSFEARCGRVDQTDRLLIVAVQYLLVAGIEVDLIE